MTSAARPPAKPRRTWRRANRIKRWSSVLKPSSERFGFSTEYQITDDDVVGSAWLWKGDGRVLACRRGRQALGFRNASTSRGALCRRAEFFRAVSTLTFHAQQNDRRPLLLAHGAGRGARPALKLPRNLRICMQTLDRPSHPVNSPQITLRADTRRYLRDRTLTGHARSATSITSSARASSLSGTSPSAFAVLRLMTSSNLVDCTTGSSAGLAPLRIRPA